MVGIILPYPPHQQEGPTQGLSLLIASFPCQALDSLDNLDWNRCDIKFN